MPEYNLKKNRAGTSPEGMSGEDLKKIAELESELSKLDKRVAELEGQIGQIVCLAYAQSPIPEVKSQMEAIKNLKEKEKVYRKQIAEIKSKATCPGCGKPTHKDMIYCYFCGYKLKKDHVEAEREYAYCSTCGLQVGREMCYCPKCGSKLIR